MRMAHGASSCPIEPRRSQAPVDRARSDSSELLGLPCNWGRGETEIGAPDFCPHRSSQVERGDDTQLSLAISASLRADAIREVRRSSCSARIGEKQSNWKSHKSNTKIEFT